MPTPACRLKVRRNPRVGASNDVALCLVAHVAFHSTGSPFRAIMAGARHLVPGRIPVASISNWDERKLGRTDLPIVVEKEPGRTIEDEQCQRIGGGYEAVKFRFLLFL